MSKNYLAKIFKCVLAITFSFTVISPPKIQANEKEVVDTAITADIYPVPQSVNYLSTEGMIIKGEVNVVLHGKHESATLPKVDAVLKKHNINYTVTNAIVDTKANIIISSDKNHCEVCAGMDGDAATLAHKEAYVLHASNDINTKGLISILASDEDGAYYGVLTLSQMLEQAKEDGTFAEVMIKDYPEIEFRGFIEGFYGYPWSHEDRMSLMRDTSNFKMNTYIYAPKDDPYHRANWKALYPDEEAAQIAELAKAGKENNFNFCWTIHPGATLKFNDEDYNALIKKFEQLYSLGVRQFGVLFDDTDDWSNGQKQADFINRIDTEFVKAKGDIKPMIVVSAKYNSAWGPGMSYFKPYMASLHSDIQIMWTGAATMSNVSKEVFDWPRKQTGVDRDVAVWWNYPVNDYCDNRVLMSPLHNLNPDLDNVTGFFSNPMNQAEASKVALYSIADYTWNTNAFEYMKSWETAIQRLVPEASDAFQRFASNISYLKDDGGSSGPFEYDESWEFEDKITNLENAIKNKESIEEPATVLLNEFKLLLADHEQITTTVSNANLLKELEPFLGAYKAMAESGIASMEALLAAERGQIEVWLDKSNLASAKLASMDTFRITSLEDSGTKESIVSVGTKRLKGLISNTISFAKDSMGTSVFKEYPAKAISTIPDLENTPVDFNEGKYSMANVTATFKENDSIGIALPKATKLNKVRAISNHNDKLALEYSLNGITWETAETIVEDDALTTVAAIGATYLRLVNTSTNTIELTIDKFETEPVYKASPSISENIGTYQTNDISKAIDGNFSTKYWSDKGPTKGHYIQIDLGKVMPLYDLKAYFDTNDYLVNSEMVISTDALTWESLGNLEYKTENTMRVASFNAGGKMARYARIQVNGSNSKWTQLFEFEFNKSVVAGDDFVDLVTGNVEGSTEALYDRDLSTAFEADTIAEDSNLSLQMTRVTNVSDLVILQDANNISGATLSVKDFEGNWKTIGKLDNQLNRFKINQEILEAKLTFDPTKPLPKIYEIITNEKTGEDVVVDKSVLNQVIASADELVADGALNTLNDEEKALFVETLNNAKAIVADEEATQERVDDMTAKLRNCIQGVELQSAKANLKALLDEYEALELSNYVDGQAKTDFIAKVAHAKTVLANVNAIDEITLETVELKNAFLALRLVPDKAFVQELKDFIARVDGLDESKYKASTLKAIMEVYDKVITALKKDNVSDEEMSQLRSEIQKADTMIANPDFLVPIPPVTPEDPTEKPEDPTEKPGAPEDKEDVPTADRTALAATFALFVIAGATIIFVYRKQRD